MQKIYSAKVKLKFILVILKIYQLAQDLIDLQNKDFIHLFENDSF